MGWGGGNGDDETREIGLGRLLFAHLVFGRGWPFRVKEGVKAVEEPGMGSFWFGRGLGKWSG